MRESRTVYSPRVTPLDPAFLFGDRDVCQRVLEKARGLHTRESKQGGRQDIALRAQR